MAWTAPRTWTDEELINDTIMNAHVRDNLRYLKGLDGVPTIESGLIIDNTDGDEYFLLPSLTTTERNALTPVNGMVIYNETTTALNAYQNSSWGLIGVTDHGNLAGLGGDDHTQYFLLAGETTDAKLYSGADLIVYSDAGSTEKMRIDGATGHIGLGGSSVSTAFGLNYDPQIAITDATRGGINLYLYGYATADHHNKIILGGIFGAVVLNSNTKNWTNAIGVIGVYSGIELYTGTASTSTVTGAAAIYAEAPGIGSSANDMVLTNYYGLLVRARTLIGNSKLTNDYGIKVEDQAGGAVLNYAIHTGAGLVHFGDILDVPELLLVPKASSTGAEGTMFYDEDDDHVYVRV